MLLQSWREILGALQWQHNPTLKQRELTAVFPHTRLCQPAQGYRLRKVIFLDLLGINDFCRNIPSLQSAMLRAGLILKLNPLAQGFVHEQPELAPLPGPRDSFCVLPYLQLLLVAHFPLIPRS